MIDKFNQGILPKFEQSFNSFATTSYDEVDETETERTWMLRLMKMLQKVKKADFFKPVMNKFYCRTGTVYPQVRTTKFFLLLLAQIRTIEFHCHRKFLQAWQIG